MAYNIGNWVMVNPLSIMANTEYNFLQYTLGNWICCSCNSLGNIVVAINSYLPLNMAFLSTDYGKTWTNITNNIGNVNLSCVYIDKNSNYISLASIRHAVYVSNNLGQSWTEFLFNPLNLNNSFAFVASGSNGQNILVANSYNPEFTYQGTYLSLDAGVNFTQILTPYDSYHWSGVAMNSSGTSMVICSVTGYCFLSSDSGSTWTQLSIPLYKWNGITIDSTGNYIAICSQDGYIYISTNAGNTWNSCSPNNNFIWRCICISSTANVIYAGALNNNIYYTTNNGVSWQMTSPNSYPSYWTSISMNSDGSVVYACVDGGNIYVMNNN